MWRRRGAVINVRSSWEKDLSFPSGHTQFFSGLATCACMLLSPSGRGLPIALGLGALSGWTRNYLGVHFCSDTLAGWALGSVLGYPWGLHDPYASLMRAADPTLSMKVAAMCTTACASVLWGVRALVPLTPERTRARWYANAIAALPPATRTALASGRATKKESEKYAFKPRAMESVAPTLTVAGCGLALTGRFATMLPSAPHEPRAPMGYRLLAAALGLLGLAAWALLMSKAKKALPPAIEGVARPLLKVVTFAGVCVWTLVLTMKATIAVCPVVLEGCV